MAIENKRGKKNPSENTQSSMVFSSASCDCVLAFASKGRSSLASLDSYPMDSLIIWLLPIYKKSLFLISCLSSAFYLC